jgi:hypothetical protein
MLGESSRYTQVQRHHGFPHPSDLRPDIVLRRASGASEHWLLVEVKLRRSVEEAARAALLGLLAYRRAFDARLGQGADVYGLGFAWGADLQPIPTEAMLCTPDTIKAAITRFAG